MSTKTSKHTLPDTVSGHQLADLIGVSIRTLSDLEVAGVVVKPERGRYVLRDSVRNYCQHLAAADDDAELRREKLRKMTADADLAEIERDRARGKLFDADKTRRAWESVVLHCRGILLALPARMAQQVTTAASVAQARAILEREVHAALTTLAAAEITTAEDAAE